MTERVASAGTPERRVLIFVGHYRPAFRAGGPIKSLENMAILLSGEFQFSFVTSDRDIGDSEAFTKVALGQWVERPEGRVYYAQREQDGFLLRRKLLKETPHELLYLSGFFARETVYALVARWLGMVPRRPVIVAPRGELLAGALRLKVVKKWAYICLAKAVGLFHDVLWHATSQEEQEAISCTVGDARRPECGLRMSLAGNIPVSIIEDGHPGKWREKKPGTARIAFLGRVSPKKNLHGALEMVSVAAEGINLDIFGPIEDAGFWAQCRRTAVEAGAGGRIAYKGAIEPEGVQAILEQYHLLLCPTFGENFGHVIFEALAAGCPVLVSDRTPWRNLEAASAGWDVPLEEQGRFVAVLDRVALMGQEEFDRWSAGALELARRYSRDPNLAAASRRLLLRTREGEA